MFAPNGNGMQPRQTIASSSNFGDRMTNANIMTLRQMQSKVYQYDASSNEGNSNIYSYHASQGKPVSIYNDPRHMKYDRPELSSPEDESSNYPTGGNQMRPDSNGDPSSSSMSGYDLKGMLVKTR